MSAAPRPSIAIVITSFGAPSPFWMPAFLHSAGRNGDVQWIVYADFDVERLPPNVAVRRMTLTEFSHRASAVFGTPIAIARPRKICDLKIAYGAIFADDLRGFDFWACSDLDIVWGDVRRFVTDQILDEHDIVSSRRNRLSGHFTLFRNTPAVTRAFDLIPDVAAAMADPHYLHLDEGELTHALKRGAASGAAGVPRVYWREALTMDAAYQAALGEGDEGRLWWRDGRTFDAHGRELMYLHFHKMKAQMRTIDFGIGDAPAAFAIDRRGMWASAAAGPTPAAPAGGRQ